MCDTGAFVQAKTGKLRYMAPLGREDLGFLAVSSDWGLDTTGRHFEETQWWHSSTLNLQGKSRAGIAQGRVLEWLIGWLYQGDNHQLAQARLPHTGGSSLCQELSQQGWGGLKHYYGV